MSTFVKIEKGIVDKPTFDSHVPAHLEFVRGLNAEGRKAKSGYWARLGGGMMIFEAASRKEAEDIVARDPLVAQKCVEYELHEWKVLAG